MTTGDAARAAPRPRLDPIPLVEIEAARRRLAGVALRTPLVRLDADEAGVEVYLKLECLQPVRSFKVRGAYNAMAKAGRAALAGGVWTVSSGNMAQAVAWAARALGVPATVFVPDTIPAVKRSNIVRYGGDVVERPLAELSRFWATGEMAGAASRLVHPFADPDVMAGNGTIGLEILEDLPDVDAVVVPWGGGGLICGIASAIAALRPSVRVYASEIDAGAPLAASLAAGRPTDVPFAPNIADATSDSSVDPAMFDLARRLIDGSIVVDREQTVSALRLVLERNRAVAEGAAATAVAAALTGEAGGGRIACVVSGGNIDAALLAVILQEGTTA
jgi:threonine dehydratase